MPIQLFYSPRSCALAPHIALEETGVPFEAILIDMSKLQQNSAEYLSINPKGRVPALVHDDFLITENPAVLRYISDIQNLLDKDELICTASYFLAVGQKT